MFIKKDLRKIEEILSDESDERETLKLAKRSPEFQGSVRILCRESKLPALANLKVLNLYDSAIESLQGIGMLSQTPLEEINLGGNKLTSIPLEFGTLAGLKALWLDDNQLIDFPICICQLTELTTLRLSGNGLKMIPDSISTLQKLETLVSLCQANPLISAIVYPSRYR
jgi:Leucine-rich repeat (LRR) protein